MIRRQDALPGQRRLRLLPAEFAHRRLRIGDSCIYFHLTVSGNDACEIALGHMNHAGLFRGGTLYRGNRLHRRPRNPENRSKANAQYANPRENPFACT